MNKEKRKYKENRVLTRSSVKGKRNLIRSLNSAIKSHDYISFDDSMFLNGEFHISNEEKFHLNFLNTKKLLKKKCLVVLNKSFDSLIQELYNSDYLIRKEAKEALQRLESDIDLIFKKDRAIIYYKPIMDANLKNPNLIIDEIDNMYIHNREGDKKETLKSIVKKTILNPLDKIDNHYCRFFEVGLKDKVIADIARFLYNYQIGDDDKNRELFKALKIKHYGSKAKLLAKKIYIQLKNRIQFRNLNFYHYNTNARIKSTQFSPTFITSLDKLRFKIKYIKQMKWIFNEYFMDKIRHYLPDLITSENGEVVDLNEYKRFLKQKQHDKIGSLRYEDYSESDLSYENSEYLAPYDYETYADDSLKDEVRNGANSFQKQFGDRYLYFSKIITKQNEENPYYNVRNYSLEIMNYYNELLKKNIFTEFGYSSQYSDEIAQVKKDIKSFLIENTEREERKEINKEVERILNIQKKEWRLLYNAFSDIEFFNTVKSYSTFNTLNLNFRKKTKKEILEEIPF